MRHSLLRVDEGADLLRRGKIIAYPTEAVFGLGCDPLNEGAVRQLLSLKNRPASAGLILIGSRFSQFDNWVEPVRADRLAEIEASWPGPVTWLFPKAAAAPEWITGAHDTLAIRVTAHPLCIALCDAFGGPLVSTSANPHSAPPARSAGQVEEFFGDFIGGIVAGALGGGARPSEIRDARSGAVIRQG